MRAPSGTPQILKENKVEQGSLIIKSITGNWPVYPGHPLVLATAIMKVFPSYAEANKPSGHGWCVALADSRIPGAGDHVGAAMRVLELGIKGAGSDAMVAYAKDYWGRGQAGGHTKYVQTGQEQAEKVEASFRDAASTWFSH